MHFFFFFFRRWNRTLYRYYIIYYNQCFQGISGNEKKTFCGRYVCVYIVIVILNYNIILDGRLVNNILCTVQCIATAKVPRNIRDVTRKDESSKFAQRVLMYICVYCFT